eukprot:7439040-Pyramimonas_sp.AAC.1
MAPSAWRRRPISAHPSHVSWPHKAQEVNPLARWRRPHGGVAQFWHAFRGPIWISAQGPIGAARTAAPSHVGIPLTRFVAP